MALKVGDKAPEFLLPDTSKRLRSLGEFLGKKCVVTFYPAAFTGVCTKQVCAFQDALSAFSALDANVVAISVDSPYANSVFAKQNKISFPVLSDHTRHVSALYAGLYLELGGIPGYTAAKRSAFVLDSDGIVRYAWISDNPGAEPNYDEVKNALATL